MLDPSVKESIRNALVDPFDVARRLGLERGSKRQRGGLHVLCPAHAERTPSCSLTRGRDGTLRVKCFGCTLAGDIYTLIAAVERLDPSRDFAAIVRRGAELAGMSIDPLGSSSPFTPRPAFTPVAPKPPPPSDEVAALWSVCRPCSADPEITHWLRERGLEPDGLERYDVARALPRGVELPAWARYQGRPWNEQGYRLLVRMHDAQGAFASVRARRVATGDNEGPKALPPTGYGTKGLVMACPLGALLLSVGAWPAHADGRIVITEGEPDFFTWVDRERGTRSFAVLGLGGSGQWSVELADRIPDGSTVILRTDRDDAGDRYAEEIRATLRGRCTVLESDAEERARRRAARAEREERERKRQPTGENVRLPMHLGGRRERR